ncbi:transferrin receptor-like dimerization domain-containing protein [Terriglobus roseus]|uniref:N-acetylated-alpha-linked acidic dipeptidase n=1 Tax=Terriglobus roseus TaxID=392734 RepID=A0A1H4U1N4_9BACT|nr:transferrin receptor-like dimerization domain-containing protein [Terriglobus roseus]SEC62174.1 N-acetylated-alpha-linked acidic dipeptidase [Terriglobus roseus]
MRRIAAASLALLLPISAITQQAQKPLLGFTPQTEATERTWEKKFLAIPTSKNIVDNMHRLAAHPHNVGSAAQRANAEWMVAQYKSWGWDAKIEQFDVLYPTPKVRVLELLGSKPYKAKLEEPVVAEDPYTQDKSPAIPPYNIYALDGDVTAPLVYVNNGMLSDYEELERNGISVKGAIVIARYGGGWRGLKPKLAYEHGAVGCIIYSDPADDGYGQGESIPAGPMRPEWGVQRGSVADTTIYAGDPLTPGEPSIPGTKRLDIKDSKVIVQIPTIPVSWGDAKPLLEQLGGRTVPAAWRGGLPMTYKFGPTAAKVHLKIQSDWGTKPVLDVIATLKGSEEPETWVVRGNHYDGWVNGADDPISGQSALLEEARALGELHKQGWSPKRTLVYAAWDGEEPGLLGSTEWAEMHADQLTKHGAVYINSDENGRGYFGGSGSQSLELMVNDVAHEMTDPETGKSVWDRQKAAQSVGRGRGAAAKEGTAERATIEFGPAGSGSDFAGFIDHLGVASVNIGFGGEDRGGTYHSAYDTPWHWDHFADKEEVYGKLFAQTAGTIVMRIADADVMPYNFTELSLTVNGYVASLKSEVKSLQAASTARTHALKSGAYTLANDPKNPVSAPPALSMPPSMDFTALDAAVAKLSAASARYQSMEAKAATLSPAKRKALNDGLAVSERKLISEAGLPGRPWTKHLIYAPGTFTGYGASTLPGVREAVEAGRYEEATQQLGVLVQSLNDEATFIDSLSAMVGQ